MGLPKGQGLPAPAPISFHERVTAFPFAGVMPRQGGKEGYHNTKTVSHPTLDGPSSTQRHSQLSLPQGWAQLSASLLVSPGRRRVHPLSPSPPNPRGCTQGVTNTGSHHVQACSVPPSHPATVPAGLKGAGAEGTACSQPWGERGDTLMRCLPLHKHRWSSRWAGWWCTQKQPPACTAQGAAVGRGRG